MKRKSKVKKILIPVSLLLVIALGLGIWKFAGTANAEPVNAYPFYYLGMTEYWGDSRESYGPVTTDKIQTVYVSDTQTVTEILVSQGDTVKKGDLLMTFDTTLSDLALERERLEVEKLKLQLEDAQKQLKQINAMKPMKVPISSDVKEEPVDLGTALQGSCQISTQKAYDGSAPEKALICWISGDTAIDDTLFEAVRQAAEEYQRSNAPQTEEPGLDLEPLSNVEESTEPTEEPTAPLTEEPTSPPTEVPTEPEPADPEPTESEVTEPEATEPEPTEPEATEPEPTEPEPTEPQPTEPPAELTVDRYYVIFKVTQDNMSLGQPLVWQGMEVTRNPGDGSFSFKLFDAAGIADHMKPQTAAKPSQQPNTDFGSGFTASEIAQMRADQQKTVKDIQFKIKMAEADYKIKQKEVADGNVYAEIDGQVVSLLSEDEARMNMQPILKVSGGGGFYVQGSVSELEKEALQLGQEVTINDWNTGMTYTGTVDSIGDFPASDGYWNGTGNPNASYYPFSVYIDGSADLQEGSYVSVMYAAGTAESGIYLENPYLRTEGGQSYVFVLGEDGKLEQRFVTTGKALWGSYTEILDGLTAEDYIAFPYGKNVRDGVDAVACEDMSQLYS